MLCIEGLRMKLGKGMPEGAERKAAKRLSPDKREAPAQEQEAIALQQREDR